MTKRRNIEDVEGRQRGDRKMTERRQREEREESEKAERRQRGDREITERSERRGKRKGKVEYFKRIMRGERHSGIISCEIWGCDTITAPQNYSKSLKTR